MRAGPTPTASLLDVRGSRHVPLQHRQQRARHAHEGDAEKHHEDDAEPGGAPAHRSEEDRELAHEEPEWRRAADGEDRRASAAPRSPASGAAAADLGDRVVP